MSENIPSILPFPANNKGIFSTFATLARRGMHGARSAGNLRGVRGGQGVPGVRGVRCVHGVLDWQYAQFWLCLFRSADPRLNLPVFLNRSVRLSGLILPYLQSGYQTG